MKYSIAFKNLPFEPERRQVIYVENEYDEQINAIIKERYDWLKWNFKRANLDFVYLPMFFNDEETKEKILYYAPYLTSEIMEKAELRSSYLLGYMSHLENKEEISPSLIYAPSKENDEWIFQGLSLDFGTDGSDIAVTQCFSDLIAEIEEVSTPFFSVRRMRRYDEDVEDYRPQRTGEPSPNEAPQVEYSTTESFWEKALKGIKQFGRSIVEDDNDGKSASPNKWICMEAIEDREPTLDEILEEDVRDTVEDLERNIERLRLLGVPLDVIVAFVAKYETISRLRITDDLRLFLPDYNNIEVKMPALYKAVYLLFIYHRKDGIVLQQLEKYHSELVMFYRKTKNIEQLTPRQLESINKLESSWNDDGSIYVVLSRIKKLFKNSIDEHLAKHYYIEGKPGEPYNIALSHDLIIWGDDNE